MPNTERHRRLTNIASRFEVDVTFLDSKMQSNYERYITSLMIDGLLSSLDDVKTIVKSTFHDGSPLRAYVERIREEAPQEATSMKLYQDYYQAVQKLAVVIFACADTPLMRLERQVAALHRDRVLESEITSLEGELARLRTEISELKVPRCNRSVSVKVKKEVAAAQGWDCAMCTTRLPAEYEIDHKQPLFLGGVNERDNLQALCPNCHRKKTNSER